MDKKFRGVLVSGKEKLLKRRSLAALRVRIVAILQMALSVFSLVNGVLLLVYSVQSPDLPYILAGPLWSGALVVLGAIFGVLVSLTRVDRVEIPGKARVLMILNLIMSILNTVLCLLSSGLGVGGIVFCFVEVPYFSERCQDNRIQRIALSGIATFFGLALSVLSVVASCLVCVSSRALGLTRAVVGKIRGKVHPSGHPGDQQQQSSEDGPQMELENCEELPQDETEGAGGRQKKSKNKVFATPSSKQILQTGTALVKTAANLSGESGNGDSFGGSGGAPGMLQAGVSASKAAGGGARSGSSTGGSAGAAGLVSSGAALNKAGGGEKGSAKRGPKDGASKDGASLLKTGASLAKAVAASGSASGGRSAGSSNDIEMTTRVLGGSGTSLHQTKNLQGNPGEDDLIGQGVSLVGKLPVGKAKKAVQGKLKPKTGKSVPKSGDNQDHNVLLEDMEAESECHEGPNEDRSSEDKAGATSQAAETSAEEVPTPAAGESNTSSAKSSAPGHRASEQDDEAEDNLIPGGTGESSAGGKKTTTQKVISTSAKVLKTAGKVAVQLNSGSSGAVPF